MKKLTFLAIAVIISIGFYSCSVNKSQTQTKTEDEVENKNTEEKIKAKTMSDGNREAMEYKKSFEKSEDIDDKGKENEVINTYSESTLDFAIDLFNLYKDSDRNIFFSPYSISSALTMTYEGASGKTAAEMIQVLHLPEDINDLRNDFKDIDSKFNKNEKSYILSTANGIWAQKDYPFKSKYFTIINDYYGGNITNVDYKKETEKSRQQINQWVEENTNNKIKDLIPNGSIDASTRMVLTNAVYFKANWEKQFKPDATYEDKFITNAGKKIMADFMTQKSSFKYMETLDFQMLEMDYMGDELSMLVILPILYSLDTVEKNLNKKNLKQWKQKLKEETVEVHFPKYKYETKYFMAKDMGKLGMEIAFSAAADFSNMASADICIDEIIHQTFIEVGEKGTEAAAATAVGMKCLSIPIGVENLKKFKADHPFIFIIQEKETGCVLFMGKVVNPENH